MDFAHLSSELKALFGRGVAQPLSEDDFNGLARRVFAFQFAECAPYRAFCEGRGVSPESVGRWQETPAVPTTAFKHVDLVSGPVGTVERVFRTSGTTLGSRARGRHLVRSLSLYHASLLPTFEAHLLPEGGSLPLLSLVPPPEQAPSSSLSEMIGCVSRRQADSTAWLVDAEGVPDTVAFLEGARAVQEAGRPALVVGTAFAFVHLLDALESAGAAVLLPAGSRLMETGGFKGRSRSVARGELYDSIHRRLGVPPANIVNEYGMTELLSQMYEPVLLEGPTEVRHHRAPPWLRVQVLDPATLEEVPRGEVGLLAFFDLANLGSVSHVLTEDLGVLTDAGLRLVGRVTGAEPRGCSLAVEELVAGGRAGP